MEPLLVLAGPTAVGKTALSLELAGRLDAEIVSIDSRQVYRELEIGVARPSGAELRRVPHHLIASRPLAEPYSAGSYTRAAEACIADIVRRGRRPLIVGGSTLYLAALTRGLSDIPDIPAETRQHLEERLAQEGAAALYEELRRVDPLSAGTMDATKTQRLIRALEVYHGTGEPLSGFHHALTPPAYSYRTVVLTTERDVLYKRIERRVDEMLASGLVEEVRGLLRAGFDPSLPVLRTIGYAEPIAFLRGEIDEVEMIRLLKRNTRRYAKRQLTWFRRFPEYRWMEVDTALRQPQLVLGG